MDDAIIRCENLVKIYKTQETEVLALQGLELEVGRGELMAIIGNSGSGKSTFLNMVGGLDRPSAGRLIVDGKDLFRLNDRELVRYKRETVGFVWQNSARNLLPYLTAQENVEMPLSIGRGKGRYRSQRQRRARARELLECVGIGHRAGSRLQQLSGGEQQRVAIAIALANQPKILLADEPTGAVDARTADHILDVFRQLNEQLGLTIVLVTHDQSLARTVNRVVAIRDGKTSAERIARGDLRARLQEVAGFAEETHDEYAILDRAGRVQIPRELLEQAGVTGNQIRMELREGQIVLSAPEEKKA